jgi:hypothetical protein
LQRSRRRWLFRLLISAVVGDVSFLELAAEWSGTFGASESVSKNAQSWVGTGSAQVAI